MVAMQRLREGGGGNFGGAARRLRKTVREVAPMTTGGAGAGVFYCSVGAVIRSRWKWEGPGRIDDVGSIDYKCW